MTEVHKLTNDQRCERYRLKSQWRTFKWFEYVEVLSGDLRFGYHLPHQNARECQRRLRQRERRELNFKKRLASLLLGKNK